MTTQPPQGLKDFRVSVQNNILTVEFDQQQSKVNTLNSKLFAQFEKILDYIEKSSQIKVAIFISAKAKCFIAGADIKELQNAKSHSDAEHLSIMGQEICSRIESLKKPVIAAINGSCLGGGLELAMACHYRIASESSATTLGLPEILLGLIPGAGGTQRLPNLVGIAQSLKMMLSGSAVKAAQAKK